MKIALALLLCGLAILLYALSLPAYLNEDYFMAQSALLSAGDDLQYQQLRRTMLTPKFALQDYGVTLLGWAGIIFLCAHKGWRQIHTPPTAGTLIAIGLLAPASLVAGGIFELFLDFHRAAFPHWADSIGIPLISLLVLFLVLLIWSATHLLFIPRAYRPAPLSLAVSMRANVWLGLMSIISFVVIGWSTLAGAYWVAIPGTIWVYFYGSLAAARRAVHTAPLPTSN